MLSTHGLWYREGLADGRLNRGAAGPAERAARALVARGFARGYGEPGDNARAYWFGYARAMRAA